MTTTGKEDKEGDKGIYMAMSDCMQAGQQRGEIVLSQNHIMDI